MEKLNKPLSWKMLLIVGAVLHTVAYFLTSYYILFSWVGVLGDIMFLLGLVNSIVYFIKKKKNKNNEKKQLLEEIKPQPDTIINLSQKKSNGFNENKFNKLALPSTIIIASIILGGFYYASQVIKQKSVEKQQQTQIQVKIEETNNEYLVKRKAQCYEIEQTERKNYNNVDGSFYIEEFDICKVRYLNEKWGKGNLNDCPVSADQDQGLNLDETGDCTITRYSYKAF